MHQTLADNYNITLSHQNCEDRPIFDKKENIKRVPIPRHTVLLLAKITACNSLAYNSVADTIQQSCNDHNTKVSGLDST